MALNITRYGMLIGRRLRSKATQLVSLRFALSYTQTPRRPLHACSYILDATSTVGRSRGISQVLPHRGAATISANSEPRDVEEEEDEGDQY